MTWMIDWLKGSGKYIVQDLENVVCVHCLEAGRPISKLQPDAMGCHQDIPGILIAMLTVGGITTLAIIIAAFTVYHMDFRWLFYRNLGILIGNPDDNEDIGILQYDAFLSFRY